MNQQYRDEIWPLREGLAKNDPEAVRKAQEINAKHAKPSPARALTVDHDCGKGIVFQYTFSKRRFCTACGELKEGGDRH